MADSAKWVRCLGGGYKCSHCGEEFPESIACIYKDSFRFPNFCPECGAKMKKKPFFSLCRDNALTGTFAIYNQFSGEYVEDYETGKVRKFETLFDAYKVIRAMGLSTEVYTIKRFVSEKR